MTNIILSQAQFGPSTLSFVLLPLLLGGPFVFVALTLLAIFRGDPLPIWLLAALVLGNVALAYFIWTVSPWRGMSPFWLAWWFAGVASEVLLPIVVILEGSKRNWFHS